jgi:hypothetical protein
MTFDQQIRTAHALDKPALGAAVESLCSGDERFAGVLRVLLDHYGEYAVAVAQQKMADSHGNLAHCAGSLWAVQLLLEEFRRLSLPAEEKVAPVPE